MSSISGRDQPSGCTKNDRRRDIRADQHTKSGTDSVPKIRRIELEKEKYGQDDAACHDQTGIKKPHVEYKRRIPRHHFHAPFILHTLYNRTTTLRSHAAPV